MSQKLLVQQHFAYYLGIFYGSWSAAEMAMDFTIGSFLNLEPRDSLLLTSSVEYGKKVRWLRDLVARSSHNERNEILRILKFLENSSNRNIFSHSYYSGDENGVVFINLKYERELQVREISYGVEEWQNHVTNFTREAHNFSKAVGFTGAERTKFVEAVLSLSNNSTASPTPPSSIACQ